MSETGWVEFAKLGRAHGLRGEIRLFPHNPDSQLTARLNRVRLAVGETVEDKTIRAIRPGPRGWIVAFEGVDDRAAADGLVNARVLVDSALFAPKEEDEYYAFELEGAALLDHHGARIGVLETVVDYGAGDLLVCRIGGREVLVPFARPYVGAIDIGARTVELDPSDFIE